MSRRPYRVVQWATGNIGRRALREVIRRPDLELAGVVVYDDAKRGVDAGVLCGEPATGVLATTDHGEAIALDADCAIYMPQGANVEEVVSMLVRGTNVVTTCGEFQAGGLLLGDQRRAEVVAACEQGGASIYATGSSPGFITEALPLTLLSMQQRVDRIEIEEYANLSKRDSPQLIFELMGFGRPVGSADGKRAAYLQTQFAPPLRVLAEAAGRPVDSWTSRGEVAAARETTQLVAGELRAGSVGGQQTVISGYCGEDEVIRFTACWYCTPDLDPAWDVLATGWRVRVRGDASMDVTVEFPVPVEELGAFTPALTANRPVNAVPYVCRAAPGILTTAVLPPLVPTGPR